jgi:hypothetical protein
MIAQLYKDACGKKEYIDKVKGYSKNEKLNDL